MGMSEAVRHKGIWNPSRAVRIRIDSISMYDFDWTYGINDTEAAVNRDLVFLLNIKAGIY